MSNETKITGWEHFPAFDKIQQMVDSTIIDKLREIGMYALRRAPELHIFENYSFNLEDSYAFAVYKDGSIIGNPVQNVQKADEPNPDVFGHDESFDYLAELDPGPGYYLVVCAKTPYAKHVENVNEGDVLISLEFETIGKTVSDFNNLKWKPYGQ